MADVKISPCCRNAGQSVVGRREAGVHGRSWSRRAEFGFAFLRAGVGIWRVRHPGHRGHGARGAGGGSGALGAASAGEGLSELLLTKVLGSFWHR